MTKPQSKGPLKGAGASQYNSLWSNYNQSILL